MTLLDHIPTELKRVADTNGGEHKGPCPWCGGKDRFSVSPEMGESGLYCCRACGKGGDGIAFLREYHDLSFAEACLRLGLDHKVQHAENAGRRQRERVERPRAARPPDAATMLRPPGAPWQKTARAFVGACKAALWTPSGETAQAWLHQRGLTDESIKAAGLGLNLVDSFPLRSSWGLPAVPKKREGGKVWLPRGIVIPWMINGQLWKVNIRRPNGDLKADDTKYIQAAGSTDAWSTNGLYHADALDAAKPAMIVEGELDALSIQQAADDLVIPVATGSTHGARKVRWLARLAACPRVLVCFDSDEAGEAAARFWIDILPGARRWRPYWSDASQMLQDGADVRAWVAAGLGTQDRDYPPATTVAANDGDAVASLRDEYAPLLLEFWGHDIIGPLACWIWFEVERLPMETWITTGLYADMDLYRRIKEGIETGPDFRNKAHLRGSLMALYDYIEGGLGRRRKTSVPRDGLESVRAACSRSHAPPSYGG